MRTWVQAIAREQHINGARGDRLHDAHGGPDCGVRGRWKKPRCMPRGTGAVEDVMAVMSAVKEQSFYQML
jgi:hypothetical protein